MSATPPDGECNTDEAESDTARRPAAAARGRLWNPLKSRVVPPVPCQRQQPSREWSAGFFSKLTFNWLTPLIHLGYQRPLEINDIWLVNPQRGVKGLEEDFETRFAKEITKGSPRPLLSALYFTFKTKFLLGALFQFMAIVAQAVSPYILKYIIAFATDAFNSQRDGKQGPSVAYGIGLVIIITALQVLMNVCTNHFLYRGLTVGGEARAVMMSRIFSKSLRLSARAKAGGSVPSPGSVKTESDTKDQENPDEGWSNGRIINLLSTDASRIDQASSFFHIIWSSPLSLIITIILLLINLGYSALPGLGILFISTPLFGVVARSLFKRRNTINKLTDKRISIISETLQSIRFIKFFNWELSFLQRIEHIRKEEIKSIQGLLALRDAVQSTGMVIPVFASMLSFITYAMTGNHQLSPAPIFSSLALFNQMRFPLSILPVALGQVIDALASTKRIQEFLLAEEAMEDAEVDYNNKNAIVIEDATFVWEQTKSRQPSEDSGSDEKDPVIPDSLVNEEPFQISGLDLTVGRSELIGVIGTVGSGKSSLLAALAGGMRKTSGSVTFGSTRAFCPQNAWIQNATVRDNIIFGREFNRDLYDMVTQACALRADFEMLPHGDETEIGERGITISGGQKQRINIARAIYFNSDIVLMDDPLSAVDAEVGRHVMDQAICGLLADKCRILATHSLHVLHRCDRIIWLDSGRIKAEGTFQKLMEQNNEFVQLMTLTFQSSEKAKIVTIDDAPVANKEEVNEQRPAEASKSSTNQIGLMQDEDRAIEAVPWHVYIGYLRAAGSLLIAPLVLFLLVISQISYVGTGLWLSWWTARQFSLPLSVWLGTYAGLGFAQIISLFAFFVCVSISGTRASKIMFDRALSRVLRAPMSFFDTTPLGRITNRFSKDVDVMDNKLTDSLRMYFMSIGNIVATFVLILAYFHLFVAALVPLVIFYFVATSYYHSSAREIKRHEAIQRSNVLAKVSEAVYGTSTIRAYGVQSHFVETVRRNIDHFDGAYFLTFANQCWLAIRLDAVGIVMIFVIGILIVTSRFTVHPSIGGLVLSYMLAIVNICSFAIRQMAEAENDMNSTERVYYYGTVLEEEAPLHIGQVPSSWPQTGEIVFKDVQLRYRPKLPLVLKGISLHIKAGERVGIIGRTGSGKSTIIQALFRIVELSGGSITIDGVDTSQIGLADFRSQLAIIPQDPTLFEGTVRSNLDPFNEHSDLDLWSALRKSGLVDGDDVGDIKLDSVVEEEGLNFSLGQRQLLAMARALVKDSKIIVCDEATSSVDFSTDEKVQQTLGALKGKTFLCIAHRLKTIIGYDRICVMDRGHVAELDSPIDLYDQGGLFKNMCDKSGIKREDILSNRGYR
ncbi:multidrug resistance-associated protein 5 [Colletotrichum truncatum]|uniref:Multidrug resistance-associated protein 5 n=1 Tax=Colletotrichum truncatum TaxID=5467 RepID=A0ACC3YTC9_COLTU|nr:multidrug resistance-associated protein 5 [Colletotrichum truncatum]KAF6798309.1 multidrug resistance-associated protein 5 [Colletotrichum truncatum]